MRILAASKGVSAEEPTISAATDAATREPRRGVVEAAVPIAPPVLPPRAAKSCEKRGLRNSKNPNFGVGGREDEGGREGRVGRREREG